MLKNDSNLYSAFKAKDARFDGRFFVGISSTGIYCRPVCRARQPKEENCRFYATAAEAEQAGYRPCLLCRPELAPGTSITDAKAVLAYRAARFLEKNCGSGQNLVELAARLGYTDRHLRRVFTSEYNVSPVQYLQTCRLLLAKNLLTDTNLSVLDIAMTAGFGSLRRFNDLFKKHYALTPTALRKCNAANKKHTGSITVSLGYRPPYLYDKMLEFLSGRAVKGVESVISGEYIRTVRVPRSDGTFCSGWVRAANLREKNALSVTVSETLLPVLTTVLAKIRQLFDLDCDPEAVYDTLQTMNKIHPGSCVKGARLPGCFDAFEMAVRAVLGQQITVKAAGTLAARIAEKFGTPINTGINGLTHTFPTSGDLSSLGGSIENAFGELGVTSARSRTIYDLAQALEHGDIDFEICTDPEQEILKLSKIRGIGNWTAQYIAMRAMEWPDAFLETDYGIKKVLQPLSPKEILRTAEAWRPWRSYAVINLWNRLQQEENLCIIRHHTNRP